MQEAQRHLSDVMGRAAPAYNRTGPAFFTEIAEHLLLRARVPSSADVLDVATGPGVLISRLGHVQGRVVGVDLSQEMIREARTRLPRHVELFQMDAGALALTDRSFDSVLCSCALQQFPKPERAVREFYRVLREGRSAASAVFGEHDPRWGAKDKLFARYSASLARVGQDLDAKRLRELFTKAGFSQVVVDSEQLDIRFPHAQAWLENAWSHGERRALEAMDDLGYKAFCEELPAALEPAREPDGFLHWRPEVIFAVGVKLEQG